MQKYGKTTKGTIRWYCQFCHISSVKTRPDTKERHTRTLFSAWTTGNQNLSEVARKKRVSRETLSRRFTKYYHQEISPIIPVSLANDVLICDGIHTDGRFEVVLIVRTKNVPIFWCAALYESYAVWMSVFSQLSRPKAIVGDGQKGMIAAIFSCWPDVPFQRCIAHVERLVRLRVSCHPTTHAGYELLRLSTSLKTVWTRRQKRRWLKAFKHWSKKYKNTINEKTTIMLFGGRKSWRYTHGRLHSAYSLINNSLPNLFTYVGHWDIPRTSNHVEGGINARIKELIHRHRGISGEKKKIIAFNYLLKRQGKPTRNVT
jgi:hypothetical protein